MNHPIQKLCRSCIKKCKQPDTAKIVRCPKYEKAYTAKDMKEIIKVMDETDHEVDKLMVRIKKLREQLAPDTKSE